MIIGNPDTFAIFIHPIKEWCSESISNGILFISIDGKLFPNEIYNSTLDVDYIYLKESLMNIPIDESLYNMKKDKAFKTIYNIVYPSIFDDTDSDYRFDLTMQSTNDNNRIFAVSNGKSIRIMASKLTYNSGEAKHILANANISETFISIDEMNDIISKLKLNEGLILWRNA